MAQAKAVPGAGSRGCQGDLEAPRTGTTCLDRPRNQPRASAQLSILSPPHPKANSKERTMPCTAGHTGEGMHVHDHAHQHSPAAEDPAVLTPNLPTPYPELSPGCSPMPWPLGAAISLAAHSRAPLGHWAPSVPPNPPATAASGPA